MLSNVHLYVNRQHQCKVHQLLWTHTGIAYFHFALLACFALDPRHRPLLTIHSPNCCTALVAVHVGLILTDGSLGCRSGITVNGNESSVKSQRKWNGNRQIQNEMKSFWNQSTSSRVSCRTVATDISASRTDTVPGSIRTALTIRSVIQAAPDLRVFTLLGRTCPPSTNLTSQIP